MTIGKQIKKLEMGKFDVNELAFMEYFDGAWVKKEVKINRSILTVDTNGQRNLYDVVDDECIEHKNVSEAKLYKKSKSSV